MKVETQCRWKLSRKFSFGKQHTVSFFLSNQLCRCKSGSTFNIPSLWLFCMRKSLFTKCNWLIDFTLASSSLDEQLLLLFFLYNNLTTQTTHDVLCRKSSDWYFLCVKSSVHHHLFTINEPWFNLVTLIRRICILNLVSCMSWFIILHVHKEINKVTTSAWCHSLSSLLEDLHGLIFIIISAALGTDRTTSRHNVLNAESSHHCLLSLSLLKDM